MTKLTNLKGSTKYQVQSTKTPVSRIKTLAICLLSYVFCLTSNVSNAQAPNAIPYQGVARNTVGNVLSTQAIAIRISVRDVTAGGTIVYQETHNTITTALGLFNVNIGSGTASIGTLAAINWGNGAKFIQVELDPSGGSSYIDMGTTQLMSVPFALFAGKSSDLPVGTANGNTMRWNGTAWVADNSIYNNGSNVGIGTATPSTALDINGQIKISGGSPGDGKILTSDANGTATWTDKVAFASKVSASSVLIPPNVITTIIFNNELYDDGSSYNPVTGIFIAPSTGRYHFDATLLLSGVSGAQGNMLLRVNSTFYRNAVFYLTNQIVTQVISTDVALNAGDQVKIEANINSSTTLYGSNQYSLFSGHKIR